MVGAIGIATKVHGNHVFRMRAPGEGRKQNVLNLDLGKADVLPGRNWISISRDLQQGDSDGVSLPDQLPGEFTGRDDFEIPEADPQRGDCTQEAGIRKAGGIHAGALPKISPVGTTREIAKSYITFGGGFVFALNPT